MEMRSRRSRALESLRRDRLCHIVYLEAVIPEPGRSLLEAAETLRALTHETTAWRSGCPAKRRTALRDHGRATRRRHSVLMPHLLRTLTDPLPTPSPMRDEELPRTYVFASDRFPKPYQKFIDACALNKNWQVICVSGGHEMMLSNAAQLAELLATFTTK